MNILHLLLLLLIAGVCGSIAQRIAGSPPRGCLVSIVCGFIGALLGSFLANKAGLPEPFAVTLDGKSFPILWSIIGAALFVAVLNFISGRRRI